MRLLHALHGCLDLVDLMDPMLAGDALAGAGGVTLARCSYPYCMGLDQARLQTCLICNKPAKVHISCQFRLLSPGHQACCFECAMDLGSEVYSSSAISLLHRDLSGSKNACSFPVCFYSTHLAPIACKKCGQHSTHHLCCNVYAADGEGRQWCAACFSVAGELSGLGAVLMAGKWPLSAPACPGAGAGVDGSGDDYHVHEHVDVSSDDDHVDRDAADALANLSNVHHVVRDVMEKKKQEGIAKLKRRKQDMSAHKKSAAVAAAQKKCVNGRQRRP